MCTATFKESRRGKTIRWIFNLQVVLTKSCNIHCNAKIQKFACVLVYINAETTLREKHFVLSVVTVVEVTRRLFTNTSVGSHTLCLTYDYCIKSVAKDELNVCGWRR